MFSPFKQNLATDKPKPDDHQDGSSEEESEEERQTTWSGEPPSSKQGSVQISDNGRQFWTELIGIDEQGKKELRFKKLPKYPNKLKMYTEVSFVHSDFSPQY